MASASSGSLASASSAGLHFDNSEMSPALAIDFGGLSLGDPDSGSVGRGPEGGCRDTHPVIDHTEQG